jgi:hypothetical protein
VVAESAKEGVGGEEEDGEDHGGEDGGGGEDGTRTGVTVVVADFLGEAEVGELGGAVGVEEDVRGLEVAVNDAGLVRVFDGVGEERDEFGRLAEVRGQRFEAVIE